MTGIVFIVVIFVILYMLYYYNPHHQELLWQKVNQKESINLYTMGANSPKVQLSEAGKYDAMQILVQRFDEGVENAIDPDEVRDH